MTATTPPDNIDRILRMRFVVCMGALLPGLGCYFCIAYTYIFQFDVIKNFTQSDQCPDVHSSLPPVSYAIGVWEPQRFVWLFIMFLHCPPRIFFLIVCSWTLCFEKYEIIWRIKLFTFVSGLLLSLSTAVSYPLFLAYCHPAG
ncbi:hypothetical protein OESDEN_11048 [Oesophagostomum dentatum]|uniref:CWH43-like N-terminal domain-containing protein n=1 Tax=Oesophagostomum dentatum TaxID=61180 RepID=A0A0B1SZ34_OESDE|nr:hypothetical protein OESDEN_11048 [Oesophagostomum dentatum]